MVTGREWRRTKVNNELVHFCGGYVGYLDLGEGDIWLAFEGPEGAAADGVFLA